MIKKTTLSLCKKKLRVVDSPANHPPSWGGDISVADSIISKKEAEGDFAPHPDLENVKTYFATWPHKIWK